MFSDSVGLRTRWEKKSLLQTAVPIDERRCFSLCRQVFIISVLLFKELEFPDMMMLVFSNRHRWHFFDTLLYAGARPNIAHLISYLIPSDFSCHIYFDKVVWFSLCLYLNVDKWLLYRSLNVFEANPMHVEVDVEVMASAL